jgi:hypothetical protein
VRSSLALGSGLAVDVDVGVNVVEWSSKIPKLVVRRRYLDPVLTPVILSFHDTTHSPPQIARHNAAAAFVPRSIATALDMSTTVTNGAPAEVRIIYCKETPYILCTPNLYLFVRLAAKRSSSPLHFLTHTFPYTYTTLHIIYTGLCHACSH